MAVELQSILTCPSCRFKHEETMPTDACLWYWVCSDCGVMHRPKPGDCCVFCSYGTVACPPVQVSGKGGCCAGRDQPGAGASESIC